MASYKELEVWREAFDLCGDIYRLTATLPDTERFGLQSQMRRGAVSIPSNIAEGYCRGSTRDYVRFLWVANGALAELETQLMLTGKLKLLPESGVRSILEALERLARRLRAPINALQKRIQTDEKKDSA